MLYFIPSRGCEVESGDKQRLGGSLGLKLRYLSENSDMAYGHQHHQLQDLRASLATSKLLTMCHTPADKSVAKVTLTALNGDLSIAERTLTLTAKDNVIPVGRASKSVTKGILGAVDNAWFDSPADKSVAKVTLTALNGDLSIAERTLTLTAKDNVIPVGRASKSVTKGILGAVDNAWFDSPVMSRNHATIEFDSENRVCLFCLIPGRVSTNIL